MLRRTELRYEHTTLLIFHATVIPSIAKFGFPIYSDRLEPTEV